MFQEQIKPFQVIFVDEQSSRATIFSISATKGSQKILESWIQPQPVALVSGGLE